MTLAFSIISVSRNANALLVLKSVVHHKSGVGHSKIQAALQWRHQCNPAQFMCLNQLAEPVISL